MKLTTTALILALIANAPAFAGGPILEDATETVEPRKDRKIGGLIIGILAIAAIAALAGGGGNCTAPEPEPQPVDPCP